MSTLSRDKTPAQKHLKKHLKSEDASSFKALGPADEAEEDRRLGVGSGRASWEGPAAKAPK